MKTFAATTFIFDVGVFKLKALVKALFDIIQFGAIEVEQTFRVDHQLHVAAVKDCVFSFSAVDKFKHIGKARTASGADAQADANTLRAMCEMFDNMLLRSCGHCNSHGC